MEDNDAVIKMVSKGRCPILKHLSRTHRVNLDWLSERLRDDPNVYGRYIHTTMQLADLFTKGEFTADTWCNLCTLLRLGPPGLVVTRKDFHTQGQSSANSLKNDPAKVSPSAGGIPDGTSVVAMSLCATLKVDD